LIKDYIVTDFIADGTFGRVVEAIKEDIRVAIKVIRPVKRYLESAEIECDQIIKLSEADDFCPHFARVIDKFYVKVEKKKVFCIVFPRWGSSLYQIQKDNSYKGFHMHNI